VKTKHVFLFLIDHSIKICISMIGFDIPLNLVGPKSFTFHVENGNHQCYHKSSAEPSFL